MEGQNCSLQTTTGLEVRGTQAVNKASRHMDVPGRAIRDDAFCVFMNGLFSPSLR